MVTHRSSKILAGTFALGILALAVALSAPPSAVEAAPGGTVYILKVVDNTGGGTKIASDFSATFTEGATTSPAFALSSSTTTESIDPLHSYSVQEIPDPSYATTYSAGCSGSAGALSGPPYSATCTITNTYIPPIGSIEIQKYSCPADTVVTRNDNGVGKTPPEGCTPEEGATFGYVHGNQTDAGPPDPELTQPLMGGGSTDSNGVLTISGLDATGRYLVEETDENGARLPDSSVLGLYCTGDGDTSGTNDNQELTFVPADGTTHCVAYDPAPSQVPPVLCAVSDTTTQTDNHDAVLLTIIHSAWVNAQNLLNVFGAGWIWGEEPLADPTSDSTEVFTKVVHITGAPTSGTIDIAADNGYQVRVNGTLVEDKIAEEHNYEATTTIAIPTGDLIPDADNTFEFTVKNFAMSGGTQQSNPAGLDYAIHIDQGSCSPVDNNPPTTPTATVVATKVVCDDEANLPNWGAGGHGPITATTAADFVAASDGKCHLQSGWQFEWGDQNAGDSGDTATSTFPGYTAFGPTDANGVATTTVPLDNLSEIHLREVLEDGYIPFTHATHPDNSDNVSAEFYCANDALNYDNWDFIRSPEANATYYCVGLNAPVPPKTSTVTMCKTDDSDHALPGWNLTLRGAHVEDVTVPTTLSAGINNIVSLLAGTSYLATATGTWSNQGGANLVDAEYSTTDNWTSHMDGYDGYSTDILELQANQAFDPNSNWGAYNSAHTYAQSFIPLANGPANFRIFDGTGTTQNEGWFGDNSGTLGVSLDEGYAGITEDNGCVTFDNVPYGTYTAGETPQDGWETVSGTGAVTVDHPEEFFTIVNRQNENGTGGSLKVHILKYLDNGDGGITSATEESAGAASFPMVSTWSDDIDSGSGSYALSPGGYATSTSYAADTRFMDAPADYATNEVTGGDSVVVADEDSCAPGKYVLEGYKTGDTLDAAESADLSTTSPAFTGLTADKYVIVVNKACSDDNGGGGGEPGGPTETFATTTVREADLAQSDTDALAGKWFFWDDGSDNRINSLGSFVDGPGTAPLNEGSAEISAAAGDRVALATYALAGTSLGDITSLQYSTYRSEGTSALSMDLQFDINTNGTSSPSSYQGRLVYEPYFAHTVSDDTWQTWNPMDGSVGWWFSHAGSNVTSSCTQATPCTWAQITAAFPDMGISAGTYFKAGQWSDDFTGNVDKFVIGITDGSNATTTTYDFEPTDENNNDGGSGGSGGGYLITNSLIVPRVLGASSSTPESCGPLLTQYLRMGSAKNLPDQVMKLQQFLEDNGFASFNPTGFFGPLTLAGVKAFQQQYASTVLTPWGIKAPTGLVYLTTERMINLLYCPTLDIPVPTPLIDWTDGAQG